MVRRFVEQKQFRLGNEGAGNRQPFAPAAGERINGLSAIRELHLSNQDVDADIALDGIDPFGFQGITEDARDGLTSAERFLLGNITYSQAAAYRETACVRLFQSGKQLEERGFSRPVGADQTGAFALLDTERNISKERACIKRFSKGLAADQRRHIRIVGQE